MEIITILRTDRKGVLEL